MHKLYTLRRNCGKKFKIEYHTTWLWLIHGLEYLVIHKHAYESRML